LRARVKPHQFATWALSAVSLSEALRDVAMRAILPLHGAVEDA
jgi:hypothetical protein